MYIYIYIYTYLSLYIYICIYISLYIYIHIYTRCTTEPASSMSTTSAALARFAEDVDRTCVVC